MIKGFRSAVVLVVLAAAVSAAAAAEKLDYTMIGKIRDQGLVQSQAMDHLGWLSDVYGPRITGTPTIDQAGKWAMKKFTDWGLANVHEEKWPFGKGWSLVRFHAHLVEPQVQPIIGYPKAWSPSTQGTVLADAVVVDIQSEADFERYRGKLRDKIVLTQPAREVRMLDGRVVLRMTDEELREAESLPVPPPDFSRQRPAGPGSGAQSLQQKTQAFFLAEGVLATLDRGSDTFLVSGGNVSQQTQRVDGGTVFVGRAASPADDPAKIVPAATIAVEHYNRMIRVLEKNLPVKVELNIQTQFHDEGERDGINVLAEIPGGDLADQVVMIGAHFDTTQAGTGATDNGVGCAVMMEAMRILQTVGARPRRTIRVALWGGEEVGLMGSRAYAKEHFADPENMVLKAEHEKLSGYFNIDNGTGRIRGIWTQGNLAMVPIFQQWMEAVRDLGVSTIGTRSVGGTDHLAFDRVGLPGFQFIQERLEYNSRSHHSNMDVFDRVQREDVTQMAVVVAIFAYNAAMRDEKLPRKALPEAQPRSGTGESGNR